MVLSAEKLRVNVSRLDLRFFIKVLIETNVNISNELIFSDIYQSVNYIGSPKFTLQAMQYSLLFDKIRKMKFIP